MNDDANSDMTNQVLAWDVPCPHVVEARRGETWIRRPVRTHGGADVHVFPSLVAALDALVNEGDVDPEDDEITWRIRPAKRVRLVRCSDPWTRIRPGTLGTVDFVDDAGTTHVTWDDGTSLGLVPGHDAWEVA